MGRLLLTQQARQSWKRKQIFLMLEHIQIRSVVLDELSMESGCDVINPYEHIMGLCIELGMKDITII